MSNFRRANSCAFNGCSIDHHVQDEDEGPSLAEAIVDGGRRMEQQILVSHPNRLPIEGTSGAYRPAWEAAGFVFGEVLQGGPKRRGAPLFVTCTFPEGWKIVPTDHYLWSDVTDPTGKVRAQVCFKPDPWDIAAHTFGLDT